MTFRAHGIPSSLPRRPPADALRLGQAAPLSAAAAAGGALLRRRRRRTRAGALPLARPAAGPSDVPAAARPRGLELGALHGRHFRQGLGGRLERRPPQPAQLRRHRAPVPRPLSLGADARSAVRDAGADRARRHPRDRHRRLLARRQSGAEAGGRARRQAPPRAEGRLRRLADDGSGRVRRGAGAPQRTFPISSTSSAT